MELQRKDDETNMHQLLLFMGCKTRGDRMNKQIRSMGEDEYSIDVDELSIDQKNNSLILNFFILSMMSFVLIYIGYIFAAYI